MARGDWNETNKPEIPGFYNRMQQIAQETSDSIQGTLAMPVKSNWGPINQVFKVSGLTSLKNNFGTSMDFTAYKLGRIALLGSPKELMLYRLADSSAKTATLTLQNSDGSPVDAIKLETLYPTDRDFKVTVASNVVNPSNKNISFYEGTTLLTKIENVTGTLEEMVTLINKSSIGKYAKASLVNGATGTLANVSSAGFTGGNNGTAAITNENYLDALEEFKRQQIDGFVLDGIANPALIASVHEWGQACKEEGLDVLIFGATNESSLDAANSVSKNYNSIIMHNGYAEKLIYDGAEYTIAEAMVYVAALALSTSLKESICNAATIFEDVQPRLTRSEITTALEAGTIVFTYSNGNVVVVDDVNTYKNYENDNDKVLGNIRAIRFINTVNQSTSLDGEENYVGKTSSDDTGHTLILNGIKNFFDEWKKLGIISSYTVETDEELQNTAENDEFFWKWSADYVNVTKRIYGTGNLQ